jgi:hypothetical protein
MYEQMREHLRTTSTQKPAIKNPPSTQPNGWRPQSTAKNDDKSTWQ